MAEIKQESQRELAGAYRYALRSPFPEAFYPQLWAWLNEFPENNFDDYGPQDYRTFEIAMTERAGIERTWAVMQDCIPVGIVAYLPFTPRSGTFHGICFSKAVHGTGLAQWAVSQVLAELFASGVEKVSASFFSSNERVARFLAGLGAVDEGFLRKHTLRNGIAIDMRLMAFFGKG